MDHDQYSLQEAAEQLCCTVTDLLKLGAAGKIGLVFWCKESLDFRVELNESIVTEQFAKKMERLNISPWDSIDRFLPLKKADIMDLYLDHKRENPGWTRITHIILPEHESILLNLESPVQLSADDLFINHETFTNLKTKLNKPSGGATSPCLDTTLPFHAKELKIAIEAWTILFIKKELGDTTANIKNRTGGPKPAIAAWLKKQYPELSRNACYRIATVINPFDKGGATAKQQKLEK